MRKIIAAETLPETSFIRWLRATARWINIKKNKTQKQQQSAEKVWRKFRAAWKFCRSREFPTTRHRKCQQKKFFWGIFKSRFREFYQENNCAKSCSFAIYHNEVRISVLRLAVIECSAVMFPPSTPTGFTVIYVFACARCDLEIKKNQSQESSQLERWTWKKSFVDVEDISNSFRLHCVDFLMLSIDAYLFLIAVGFSIEQHQHSRRCE